MLGINMNDVITTLGMIKGYLIALAVILVIAVAVTIAAMKLPKPTKGIARGSAWMGFIVALVIIVDMILTGPLYGIVGMALRGGGDISEDSVTNASALCEDIADEGFVLLKNEDGLLPLGDGAKVNTFGWSATKPVYGGTGSGSLSGLYPTVTLLEGIKQAGVEYNEELTSFYTAWKDKRPNIGMMGQDWTCPEPTIDEYEAAGMFDKAAAYSDVAMIVISRAGGEGADLPTSLDPSVPDTFQDDGSGTMFAASGLRFSEYPEDLDASKHYLEPTTRELAMIEKVTSQFDKVIVVVNASNAMELGWIEDYPSIKSVILAPGPGQTGFNALGNILSGKVNPSGRTVDTFVYDLTAIPAFNNIGEFKYTNLDDVSPESYGQPVTPNFVNYVEGIYVGYRWYETAAAENAIDYAAPICGFEVEYATYSTYDEIITSAENLIQAGCKVVMTTKASTSLMDLCEQNEVYMAQWGSPIDDPELAQYLAKSPYWVGCSTVDDYDAGYQCVENLYENGCRNIALIGTGAGNYCHDLRFTGMYDAAKTHDDLKIVGEFRSASLQSEGAAAVQNFCALYPELDGIVASGASNGILELVIQTLDTEGRSDVKFATLDIQPGTDEYLEEGSLSFIGGGQYLEVMFLAIDAVNIVDGAYEGNTQLDTKFIYITGADDYDFYVQYIDNEGVYPYSPEELQSVTYRCNPEMKFEDLYGMWNSYTLDSIVAKNQ